MEQCKKKMMDLLEWSRIDFGQIFFINVFLRKRTAIRLGDRCVTYGFVWITKLMSSSCFASLIVRLLRTPLLLI